MATITTNFSPTGKYTAYGQDTNWIPAYAGYYSDSFGAARDWTGGYYDLDVGLAIFDTGSIPNDAQIVSARLLCTDAFFRRDNNYSTYFKIEWGTYSTYSQAIYNDNNSGNAYIELLSKNSGTQYSPNLVLLNPTSYINKSGYTSLRINIILSSLFPQEYYGNYNSWSCNNITLEVTYETGYKNLVNGFEVNSINSFEVNSINGF